tara:strand:- start:812 stop:1096 length:285 start_codon:yes stop_codon:yes gene_type:complete
MASPIIKLLVLKNDSKVLITKIKEMQSELGEPDCQLTDPVEFRIEEGTDWKERLQRWPGKLLTQDHQCMISSDAILTILDPQPELLEAYQEVIS